MVSKKTSAKRSRSRVAKKSVVRNLRPTYGRVSLPVFHPEKHLVDLESLKRTVAHCFVTSDWETLQDVLIAAVHTHDREGLASKAGIGRRTLFNLLDKRKPFNPTVRTLGAIFEALAA